jgi:hypothetical protein
LNTHGGAFAFSLRSRSISKETQREWNAPEMVRERRETRNAWKNDREMIRNGIALMPTVCYAERCKLMVSTGSEGVSSKA